MTGAAPSSSALPRAAPVRLGVRALIVEAGRLLVVNAYADPARDLWCAPGGGVEAHQGLLEALVREVFEETGLTIAPGPLALVNEFHSRARGFHQVELFFRARVTAGRLDPDWRDPEGIVHARRLVTRAELARLPHKPDALAAAAFDPLPAGGARLDPLEEMI